MTGNWNQNRFSLNADAEERYRNDNQFRYLVNLMRAELRRCEFTPSELRQASILASTMHECERIKPLYVWIDEAKDLAVFGGPTKGEQTATGAMQYDKWSDLAYVNSNKHCHYFDGTGRDYGVCVCGISDVYYNSDLYNYKAPKYQTEPTGQNWGTGMDDAL